MLGHRVAVASPCQRGAHRGCHHGANTTRTTCQPDRPAQASQVMMIRTHDEESDDGPITEGDEEMAA